MRYLVGLMALACQGANDAKVSDTDGETDPPAAVADVGCPAGWDAVEARAVDLVSQMTLEQKVAQMSGGGVTSPIGTWGVRGVEELDVPSMNMVDGPRGLSRTAGEATAFPVSSARAASWDPSLERRVGKAIGIEVASAGGHVVLAPTINVLRHPAWGRAQETYGEDTTLIGDMGAAFIEGAQEHVMASVKHLAVNSIEDTRFDVDVVVGQRALREIYLPAFQQAVDVGVASIMSAYNSMNGAYCAENKPLLRDILKDEWGFRGFVESDWVWGMYSTVPSLEAGLDLEMPGANWYGDKLLAAVQAGEADEALVDEAVTRVLRMKLCYGLDEPQPEPDETLRVTEEHVALAREVATRSSVLLRNEGAALPLDASSVSSVVVLGPLADVENIGDQGSSAVAPPEVVTVWEGLSEALGDKVVMYAELDDTSRAAAEAADAVILVVGLTSDEEGEGFIAAGDRASLSLPAEQEAFINEVAALNDRTIAVLEGSSSIVTEAWIEEVDAVLEVWYPGMAGGHAVADLLLGVANPSGRLPVSFPRSMDDLPVFDNVNLEVSYDLWHGYRHLLREGTSVRFPFGFGLSYTTWQISAPQLAESAAAPGDVASVQATVTNTGDRDGIETVQVYASAPGATLERAPLWLVGFAQVEVAAGGEAQVQVSVPTERLAAWDESAGAWTYEPGSFELWVGSSVDDVASAGTLTVQ